MDSRGWNPLFSALDSFPSLQVIVIIDPLNGPGADALPDSNYIAGISFLNAYSNVRTIGYVRSTKGARPISEYQADIDKYANWDSLASADISMHGIFIDEANNDPAALQYYADFSSYAHQRFPDADAVVVQNPGVTTPQTFFDTMPTDVFVTFENFASQMWAPFTIFTDPLYANTPHERQAAIFHDFGGSTTDLVNITDTVGETAAMRYIFVTTQSDYNSFSTNLSIFVAAVNGTNNFMAQHPEWYPRD